MVYRKCRGGLTGLVGAMLWQGVGGHLVRRLSHGVGLQGISIALTASAQQGGQWHSYLVCKNSGAPWVLPVCLSDGKAKALQAGTCQMSATERPWTCAAASVMHIWQCHK